MQWGIRILSSRTIWTYPERHRFVQKNAPGDKLTTGLFKSDAGGGCGGRSRGVTAMKSNKAFTTRIAGAATLGVAVLIGYGLSAPPAQAAYIVTLTEQS